MIDQDILKIGKSVFRFSFYAGTILFFSLYSGFMNESVVFSGSVLCLFAMMNAWVFFALMIYGLIHQSKFVTCLKSAAILLINIPIAFVHGCFIDI